LGWRQEGGRCWSSDEVGGRSWGAGARAGGGRESREAERDAQREGESAVIFLDILPGGGACRVGFLRPLPLSHPPPLNSFAVEMLYRVDPMARTLCTATTGGSSLFFIYIYIGNYVILNIDHIYQIYLSRSFEFIG
jgi:hypothetical protein